MEKIKSLIILATLTIFNANATFSLVAYDPRSGLYGAAFASCVYLPPTTDITEHVNAITPIGTITTQATVNFNNLNLKHGKEMILNHVVGQQILDWLYDHDQDGVTGRDSRQYLILNSASSAPPEGSAYTGGEVPSAKSVIISDNVVVAGNTLHPNTVPTMLEGYYKPQDFFVDKLLEGLINVRDNKLGDSRCDGVSSYTAFVKINNRSWFYNSQHLDEDAIDGLEKIVRERQKPKVCLSLIAGTAFLANIDLKGDGHYIGPYGVGKTVCADAKPGEVFTPQLSIIAGTHKECPSVTIKEDTGTVNYEAWGTTFSPSCIIKGS